MRWPVCVSRRLWRVLTLAVWSIAHPYGAFPSAAQEAPQSLGVPASKDTAMFGECYSLMTAIARAYAREGNHQAAQDAWTTSSRYSQAGMRSLYQGGDPVAYGMSMQKMDEKARKHKLSVLLAVRKETESSCEATYAALK